MGKSKAKSASQAILMPSLAQITDPNSPGEAPGGDHLLQGPPLPVESGQEQLVLALHDVALTSARKCVTLAKAIFWSVFMETMRPVIFQMDSWNSSRHIGVRLRHDGQLVMSVAPVLTFLMS